MPSLGWILLGKRFSSIIKTKKITSAPVFLFSTSLFWFTFVFAHQKLTSEEENIENERKPFEQKFPFKGEIFNYILKSNWQPPKEFVRDNIKRKNKPSRLWVESVSQDRLNRSGCYINNIDIAPVDAASFRKQLVLKGSLRFWLSKAKLNFLIWNL